jgi:hypothetical protein
MVLPRNNRALIAFLDARVRMPHAWGSDANDCIAFAAGAVLAQTGRDPIEGLSWSTKAGALRLLKSLGGMEAALDGRFERVPVALAKRGDIAGVPATTMIGLDDDERALIAIHPMIVEGATLASPGERGLLRAPRWRGIVAWDIASPKDSRDG